MGVRERQIDVGWTVKKTVGLVSRTLEKGASVGGVHTLPLAAKGRKVTGIVYRGYLVGQD